MPNLIKATYRLVSRFFFAIFSTCKFFNANFYIFVPNPKLFCMAKPIEVTDANFEEVVVKSGKVAVLDLWAEWCGPCRMLDPIMNEMADEYDGRAIIGKVNVDFNPGIPQRYGVLNIPTVLFVKDGELLEKVVGAVPKRVLVETLEKFI